jgi:hypothetical protein
MFDFAPHSRDALTRATAVAGHAYAWMLNLKLFVVGSLGRGGISEAASLGEQYWMLSKGVLGETALPWFCGGNVRMCEDGGRADGPHRPIE